MYIGDTIFHCAYYYSQIILSIDLLYWNQPPADHGMSVQWCDAGSSMMLYDQV